MKKGVFIVLALIICFMSVSMVSAGIFDFFRLTGKATEPTNVTVGVVGVSQVTVGPIDNSTLIDGVNPIESNSVDATVYATVCDEDGVGDVNLTATEVVYHGPTGQDREGSCSYIDNIDSNCANFSCTATMWYWDAPGTWIINVSANDKGNQTPNYNDSYTFVYNQLKSMVISPDLLMWGNLDTSALNQTADNDPTIINNTGNYNGAVYVTGYNLLGETEPLDVLGVNNFSVSSTDGNECGVLTSDILSNDTPQTIDDSNSNPGNLSMGGGVGQETLYYCIREVPTIPSQIYSTENSNSWIIGY